jgi:hypothetical protein
MYVHKKSFRASYEFCVHFNSEDIVERTRNSHDAAPVSDCRCFPLFLASQQKEHKTNEIDQMTSSQMSSRVVYIFQQSS